MGLYEQQKWKKGSSPLLRNLSSLSMAIAFMHNNAASSNVYNPKAIFLYIKGYTL